MMCTRIWLVFAERALFRQFLAAIYDQREIYPNHNQMVFL